MTSGHESLPLIPNFYLHVLPHEYICINRAALYHKGEDIFIGLLVFLQESGAMFYSNGLSNKSSGARKKIHGGSGIKDHGDAYEPGSKFIHLFIRCGLIHVRQPLHSWNFMTFSPHFLILQTRTKKIRF